MPLGVGKFRPSLASCIGRVCVETDGWSVTRREAEVDAELTTCEKDGECAAPTPIRCDCSIRKENQITQSNSKVEKFTTMLVGGRTTAKTIDSQLALSLLAKAASVRVYAHSLKIQMEANER